MDILAIFLISLFIILILYNFLDKNYKMIIFNFSMIFINICTLFLTISSKEEKIVNLKNIKYENTTKDILEIENSYYLNPGDILETKQYTIDKKGFLRDKQVIIVEKIEKIGDRNEN